MVTGSEGLFAITEVWSAIPSIGIVRKFELQTMLRVLGRVDGQITAFVAPPFVALPVCLRWKFVLVSATCLVTQVGGYFEKHRAFVLLETATL